MKKWQQAILLSSLSIGSMASVVGGAIVVDNMVLDYDYVVTGIDDKYVTFRPLVWHGTPNTMHYDTTDVGGEYLKHLHVGDTISGARRNLDRRGPISPTVNSFGKRSVIRRVNGKTIDDIRRDKLVRENRTKQK